VATNRRRPAINCIALSDRLKPKFYYADFATFTETSPLGKSRTQIIKVHDKNHVADFYNLCPRLSPRGSYSESRRNGIWALLYEVKLKLQFLRATAEYFARLCHRLGVCLSLRPSVRPSVTLVSCIKTVQARITKSSLWAAPRSLVYRDKISCHWVQGFPSNEGVEEGYPPPKKTSFCRYWLE